MAETFISRDLFTTKVNSTMMSMNERFTYLQKKARTAPQVTVMTIRAKNSAQQQASARNRRLVMQMEKRLSAMAALKLKKKSIRQRLGVPNNQGAASIRDRLSLPKNKAGLRQRKLRQIRNKSLQRTQSLQSLQGSNLQKTASMQSLNKINIRRGRSRSRSRTRMGTPSRNARSNSLNKQSLISLTPINRQPIKTGFGNNGQRRYNSGSFGQQQNSGLRRGRRNSRGNKFLRNQRGNNFRRNRGNFSRNTQNGRQQQMRGRRGQRGRLGNKGRLGKGNKTNVILPTKEELDKQLEQYMSNKKSHLDKEIDTYMKESGVNNFSI